MSFLALAVLVGGAALSHAWATPEEGISLRAFLADATVAAIPVETKVQASEMQAVFAKHPDVVQWVVEGRNLDPMLIDADLDGAVPPGKLQAVLQSVTEALQASGNFGAMMVAGQIKRDPDAFRNLGVDSRVALLKKVGDAPFLQVGSEVNQMVAQTRLSNSAAVKTLMDPANAIAIADFPKDKAGLFNELVVKYYDALPLAEKRPIITEQLKLPPHSSIDKQLSVLLQNSGPAIQKLFQLFGKDAKSQVIRDAMAELFSSVKPFPGQQAVALLEARLGKPIGDIFSEFTETPIAAATVGQVHKARLRATGEQVVVKILRPGIIERGKKDMVVFRSIISDSPFERALVTNLDESLMLELNFLREDANITSSKTYIRPEEGLSIAERVARIPAYDDVLVLKVAPGTNMSKTLRGIPAAERGQAINNLLARWYEEAIFGSGKFHADLHPGNLFYCNWPAV